MLEYQVWLGWALTSFYMFSKGKNKHVNFYRNIIRLYWVSDNLLQISFSSVELGLVQVYLYRNNSQTQITIRQNFSNWKFNTLELENINNNSYENAEVTFYVFYFCLQEESFETVYSC